MSDGTELNGRDTDPDVLTTLIVNTLKEIKGELDDIRRRLDSMDDKQGDLDDQLRYMVNDIRTVHELQKSTISRLGSLERHWVEEPLEVEKSVDLKVVDHPTPFPAAAKRRKT